MNWKWGGLMNSKCIYYVEGPCEQQLIAALKESPAKLVPGKVKIFNVVQNLIPKSQMLSIQAGTIVILVFDTDVPRYNQSPEKSRITSSLLWKTANRLLATGLKPRR